MKETSLLYSRFGKDCGLESVIEFIAVGGLVEIRNVWGGAGAQRVSREC